MIVVALLNVAASAAYDFYVRPNTPAAPVKVTTATTNAQGHVAVFAPTLTPVASAKVPTSVVVSVAPAGGTPGAPAFTLTASGKRLTTIPSSTLMSASLSPGR